LIGFEKIKQKKIQNHNIKNLINIFSLNFTTYSELDKMFSKVRECLSSKKDENFSEKDQNLEIATGAILSKFVNKQTKSLLDNFEKDKKEYKEKYKEKIDEMHEILELEEEENEILET